MTEQFYGEDIHLVGEVLVGMLGFVEFGACGKGVYEHQGRFGGR
jgi:hypothetical protein